MTSKSDLTEQEWEQVLHGPPTAGLIVLTAQRGGTFRETYAMAKTYAEARQQHGASELLDDIVSHKPEMDHTRHHSPEELREYGLKQLRDAVAVLEQKATPDEVAAYRGFVLQVANAVAGAHREHGADVSPAEQQAVDEITAALGGGSGDGDSAGGDASGGAAA